MDKYKAIREIPFSYSSILKIAIRVSVSMGQNLEKFSVYNISEANYQYFNELIDRYRNNLNDKMMVSNISSAVESKNSLRKSITNMLRSIAVRAKSVYDEYNASLKAFNPGAFARLSDLEFGETAKGICKLAVKEIEELSKEGLTIEYLEILDNMIDEYNALLSEIRELKYERETATAKRHEICIELYELLTKYCRYGKRGIPRIFPCGCTCCLLLACPCGLPTGFCSHPGRSSSPTSSRSDWRAPCCISSYATGEPVAAAAFLFRLILLRRSCHATTIGFQAARRRCRHRC